jgi:tetratricopeptide (TPR) repeat protein
VLIFQSKHNLALQAYERALSINPNDPDINAEYADALQYVDRPKEGLALMRRAMALNPYYPDWYLWTLGDIYFALDQHDDVVTTVQQMTNPLPGSRLLAASLALTGRREEARIAASGVLMIDPHFSVRSWTQRLPYCRAEPIKRFAEGLRLAGLPD